MKLDHVREAYEATAGQWTGCDWPTRFGQTGLDLNGWTAAVAAGMAAETTEPAAADDWLAAVAWLAQVEQLADQAAVQAALAVAAASAEDLDKAAEHARQAWLLEQQSGRPEPPAEVPSWRQLYAAVREAQAQAAATAPPAEPPLAAEVRRLTGLVERLERRIDDLEGRRPIQPEHRFRDRFSVRT